MPDQERDDPNVWRLVVMRPTQLLVYANVAAATAAFAFAGYWCLYYLYTATWVIIGMAALGGALSLVAFVGAYLHRPRQEGRPS